MAKDPSSSTLLVTGLGLLGGSVLCAARKANLYARYLGYDAQSEILEQAHQFGITDNAAGEFSDLAQQADLIVIAVPVLAFSEVFLKLRQANALDRYITDVASVKAPIVQAAEKVAAEPPAWFVPAHPITGSEQSGLQAARADLFQAHKVIVTPHKNNDSGALSYIGDFWAALGAEVVSMDATVHDTILASTSHLPHVLAYVLVNTLLAQPNVDSLFEFAAGGFRDFSRIASSDPTMWHDILLANKAAVLDAIDQFGNNLQITRRVIERDDGSALFKLLSDAKTARDTRVVLTGEKS